jgi:hypothetical protein
LQQHYKYCSTYRFFYQLKRQYQPEKNAEPPMEASLTDERIISRTPPTEIHDCEFVILKKKKKLVPTTSLNMSGEKT